jgi:hypothetical protein
MQAINTINQSKTHTANKANQNAQCDKKAFFRLLKLCGATLVLLVLALASVSDGNLMPPSHGSASSIAKVS